MYNKNNLNKILDYSFDPKNNLFFRKDYFRGIGTKK